MKEPFKRIAMDIVCPLPRNRQGNQYILIVCDYATRYPEASPLRSIDAGAVAVFHWCWSSGSVSLMLEQWQCSIDAGAVAEHLIQLFSRVGIPREILTDQGTNFMSQLLKELYNLLYIS